jgi:multiple sugar transport system permease protein
VSTGAWKHTPLAKALYAGAMLVVAVWALFPLYWMVATSLKPGNLPFAYPPVWTFRPTLEHYAQAIARGGMLRAFPNSLIVASADTVISVVLGALAAFGLARFPLRRKRDIWFWIISNRMMTPVAMVLPFFLLADALNLLDTRLVLILAYLTFNVPLVVWIMLGFFQAVPVALDEAAMIDGAGYLTTLLRITLPLTLPGLVVSAIFVFIFSWNELLFALVLTREAARTMPVLTTTFMTGMGIEWGQMAATGTATVLPIVVFSLFVSRYIVRGLTLGAVK